MKHLKRYNENNQYQELTLIPQIDASDFSDEMEMECVDNDINTHYQADTLYINWNRPEHMPSSKEWLLKTYGDVVKKYDRFSIIPT